MTSIRSLLLCKFTFLLLTLKLLLLHRNLNLSLYDLWLDHRLHLQSRIIHRIIIGNLHLLVSLHHLIRLLNVLHIHHFHRGSHVLRLHRSIHVLIVLIELRHHRLHLILIPHLLLLILHVSILFHLILS